MEEPVQNPRPEAVLLEKDTFLALLVKLRVAVQQSSRDVLVEDAYGKWRHNSEEHVVERERPRLEDDLSGKGVLKRIL